MTSGEDSLYTTEQNVQSIDLKNNITGDVSFKHKEFWVDNLIMIPDQLISLYNFI